ncbi:hypothetical protein NC651_017469 [Populus alba x Populus x berolinensis]|nr:hypothetical protein NC651_017469 [Populus alba x Populus x berolinensis]
MDSGASNVRFKVSSPPVFFSGPFKAFVWLLRKSDSGIRWQFILRVISSKNPDSFANYLWRLKSQGTFGCEIVESKMDEGSMLVVQLTSLQKESCQ